MELAKVQHRRQCGGYTGLNLEQQSKEGGREEWSKLEGEMAVWMFSLLFMKKCRISSQRRTRKQQTLNKWFRLS